MWGGGCHDQQNPMILSLKVNDDSISKNLRAIFCYVFRVKFISIFHAKLGQSQDPS
jgi:hypothetical protein